MKLPCDFEDSGVLWLQMALPRTHRVGNVEHGAPCSQQWNAGAVPPLPRLEPYHWQAPNDLPGWNSDDGTKDR